MLLLLLQLVLVSVLKKTTSTTTLLTGFHIFLLGIMIITPHAQRERGKVIGRMFERKKNLNRTLEIDSPFQTFAVGLFVEFID